MVKMCKYLARISFNTTIKKFSNQRGLLDETKIIGNYHYI